MDLALTPEEQKTHEELEGCHGNFHIRYGHSLETCPLVQCRALAIIRRLDAEIARLAALLRHAERDCVILRDRAIEASNE